MEPVTHVLTGACLARAGLNRRAAYATLAMAVAAEFPDIDTLWSIRGPVSAFEHHRGITHTLTGIPVEAALILLLFVVLHRIRCRRQLRLADHGRPARSLTAAPVRWPVLYVLLLLALGSHLLLDFTNNYGLRPFFPFQTRWYAASIVFIFDPLIFLLLLAGLLLPTLFGLVDREVGAGRRPFRGAGWARAALVCIVAIWILRAHEHRKAVVLAEAQTIEAPADQSPDGVFPAGDAPGQNEDSSDRPRAVLPAQRSLASPDPFSPFRWYTATDFGPSYRLGTANTRTGLLFPGQLLAKPSPTPALIAAERSRLGRIYLDWSAMPWLNSSRLDAAGANSSSILGTDITFQDLRFMGSSPFLGRRGQTPLTGEVVVGSSGAILQEGMDGHFGR